MWNSSIVSELQEEMKTEEFSVASNYTPRDSLKVAKVTGFLDDGQNSYMYHQNSCSHIVVVRYHLPLFAVQHIKLKSMDVKFSRDYCRKWNTKQCHY